jgi:hypothetical protein
MATLKPIPGKPCYRCSIFEQRIRSRADRYNDVSGVPMAYAGFVTRGKDGTGKCEAHLIFPEKGIPDFAIFKKVFRESFDLCVTGTYQDHEVRPRISKNKNRTAHRIVLAYVASHADHKGSHALWELGTGDNEETRERDAEFQRGLENQAWLGQNKPKTVFSGDLVAGQQRAVGLSVLRELPRMSKQPSAERRVMLSAAQAAPRRRELSAGKRRLLPNGQVVMTLPRSDSARLFDVVRISGVEV